MNPPITKEGNKASNRIREVRQNVTNGATPTEARKTVRQIESGPVQPTITADALVNPLKPVTVPEPVQSSIPSNTLNIARNVSRDTDGFISAQTEEAKQLNELQATYGSLGNEGSLSELFNSKMNDNGVTSNSFKELKDIQLQLTDMDTKSGLNKVTIESGGQGAIQGQRSLTQEDREAAVRSAGLAARAAVLQGNIQTATALAKDAVSIAYQDRTLKATNLLNQIEMVQGQVDDQTAQLLEQEKRGYEAELAAIKEVKEATSTAMVNGASQSEIAQLTDPTIDDATKLALAQSITARGANEMRDLDMEAKSANIQQSYASIAASNTNRLLALAEAGDPEAISGLGFDPRTIEEEIDPVTRRQLESSVDAGANLLRLADKYKKIIDDYGYTNTTFGDSAVLGEISSLRALMTAEYKKAETLGTLDAGVLALMSQIIGEEPTSGFFTPLTNATGRRSNKLSSQLGTFVENITIAQAKDKARLGIEPTVDFSLVLPDDDAEINAAFGIKTSTQTEGGFNPQTYFNNKQ